MDVLFLQNKGAYWERDAMKYCGKSLNYCFFFCLFFFFKYWFLYLKLCSQFCSKDVNQKHLCLQFHEVNTLFSQYIWFQGRNPHFLEAAMIIVFTDGGTLTVRDTIETEVNIGYRNWNLILRNIFVIALYECNKSLLLWL